MTHRDDEHEPDSISLLWLTILIAVGFVLVVYGVPSRFEEDCLMAGGYIQSDAAGVVCVQPE